MSRRLDLIGECNVQGFPLDVLSRDWCARCSTAECTRSIAGKLKFDQRVGSWYERLFSHVPRMDPQDPRYGDISKQKFLMYDPGPVPEISSQAWNDPRDLEKRQPASSPPASPPPPPAAAVRFQPVEPPPTPPSVLPPPEHEPIPGARAIPRQLLLANAPPQKEKTIRPPGPLSTAPPAASAPKDPWGSPSQPPPANVVQSGAKIKFGRGV